MKTYFNEVEENEVEEVEEVEDVEDVEEVKKKEVEEMGEVKKWGLEEKDVEVNIVVNEYQLTKKENDNKKIDSEKIYVIGDIHGCYDELKALLEKIQYDGQGKLIFLGDYIDRGNKISEVVTTIYDLQKTYGDDKVITLKGNHEDMLVKAINNDTISFSVLYPEISRTLNDFIKNKRKIDKEWFENLPLYHIDGDYLFVHAGVDTYFPLDEQLENDLLWIRDEFYLNANKNYEKRVVFGHTPIPYIYSNGTNRISYVGNNIAIDTCCFATGKLSCLELPSFKIYETGKEVIISD